MKITDITWAALAALLLGTAAAAADDSAARFEIRMNAHGQANYLYVATEARPLWQASGPVTVERSTTVGAYVNGRGLGESPSATRERSHQTTRLEHLSTGNGGDMTIEVPAD